MRFFSFLAPRRPESTEWVDHPDLRRMTLRDLADLPVPRPPPVQTEMTRAAVYQDDRAA